MLAFVAGLAVPTMAQTKPAASGGPAATDNRPTEMQLLRENWEIPIVGFVHGPLVRLSAHLYNHADQADAVAKKLLSLGVRGRRL